MPLEDLLDAGQLGLSVGIGGLLPGLGALKGELVGGQQPAGPFPADVHDPPGVVGQVADQLAQAPVGERLPEFARGGWWPSG
jgi:hypothetical protein